MKPQCWSTWPVIPSFPAPRGHAGPDPHSSRTQGTVSLVERQLDRQRERIEQLEQEITELMGIASENERIFRVYADLYGELYGCQSLFEVSAVMGKAFVQRLRLTGLRLWLSPKKFQLSGPEQKFMAEGRQLEQLLGQRLPGQGLLLAGSTRARSRRCSVTTCWSTRWP